MPPNLLQSGFVPSLKDLLRRNSERNLFRYTLNSSDDVDFSHETAYQILQILGELISNSTKHGKSDLIDIQFKKNHTSNEIIYRDNGTMYDFYTSAAESLGLGLRNILFRVQTLNGTFRQENSQTGNSFVIVLPHEN